MPLFSARVVVRVRVGGPFSVLMFITNRSIHGISVYKSVVCIYHSGRKYTEGLHITMDTETVLMFPPGVRYY